MLPKWLLVCATKPEWGELKKHLRFERDPAFHGLNFFRAETGGTAPRISGSAAPGVGVSDPDLAPQGPGALRSAKKEILLGQIGVGFERARQTSRAIFHSFSDPPRMVVHFGLSGGLTANLKEGDIVLPPAILNPDGQSAKIRPDLVQKAETLLHSLNLPAAKGTLLTAARVLPTPDEKKKAGEKFGAIAVDMETFPFARECEKTGIPFLSIRAIWDPLDRDLSALPETNFDRDGNLKMGYFLGQALAHPQLLLALPKYHSAMMKGNRAITRVLMEMLEKWDT
ncbi:MAG: hypothetical protein HY541_08700 [Deltaproteobacteria bacterium]|nr:hypothetical protein [Deltaproteobacteria bacterium]